MLGTFVQLKIRQDPVRARLFVSSVLIVCKLIAVSSNIKRKLEIGKIHTSNLKALHAIKSNLQYVISMPNCALKSFDGSAQKADKENP